MNSLLIIGVSTPGRMYRVNPNVVRGKMIGVYAHQSDDSVLRRGISDRAGVVASITYQAHDRADQHDRPTVALFDQGRLRGLDSVKCARQVDVDHVAPAVFTRLHWRDARVGDDDVEVAELVEARL